jgi:hypothetical protein
MAEEKQFVIVSERDLTPDENLWLDIRADGIKQTPARVSESLVRLVTLATALAGGAIGVLKDDVSTSWGRFGAAAFFFAALLAAAIGSLPRSAALPDFPVEAVRGSIQGALRFKERCAKWSLSLLAAGMLFALLGIGVYSATKPVNIAVTNPARSE